VSVFRLYKHTSTQKVVCATLTHSLPQPTLVDLIFQSCALCSFSLNQLRDKSL